MKIIQFQAMENNATWQGCILGLGDNGVLYVHSGKGWDKVADSSENKKESLNETT